MRPTTLKATPWFIAILCLGFATTALARARYVEERAYIGGLGLFTSLNTYDSTEYTGFSGDYRYRYTVSTYAEENIVPKIKSNYGFGGLIGYRRGDYAVEIAYWRSDHKAEFNDGSITYEDTATYHSFNVDLKRFLFTYMPIQPYFSFGVCFPWLITNNTSATFERAGSIYQLAEVTDTSFSGMGFNVGAGFEFFATPEISITGGAVKRWLGFSRLKGAATKLYELQNAVANTSDLKDSSFDFQVGATVSFF